MGVAGAEVGERKEMDGTVWEITWQDDFEGAALNLSNWTPADNYTHGLLIALATAGFAICRFVHFIITDY